MPQSPTTNALVLRVEKGSVNSDDKNILEQDNDWIYYYNGKASKKRRDTVLEFMCEQGYITSEEKDKALSASLKKHMKLKDNGAVLAGGTDCPVVEGNLFWGMYAGNTRKYYDDIPEGGWNPQEKLTMPEMIDMFTSGAAYAEHRENELGTLEAGKLADITVVDRNLLELEENPDIRDTKVLLTMVDGRVVYS